jgi:hypothetical protein
MMFADGLSVYGDSQGDDYVTGQCGVKAVLWEDASEDAVLIPSWEWDSSLGCDVRMLNVDVASGVGGLDMGQAAVSQFQVIGLNALVPDDGAWHLVPVQLLTTTCQQLRFDAGDTEKSKVHSGAPWVSDNVRAMRMVHPVDPAKRAWQVETQPRDADGTRHDMASCFHRRNAAHLVLDGYVHVPFSVTIVEH